MMASFPSPSPGPSSLLFPPPPQVCVYVDLHGHSRKHNVFMYGCHQAQADHTHLLYERILPFLLSQQVVSFSFLPLTHTTLGLDN